MGIVPEMMVVRDETGPRDVEALIIDEDVTLRLNTKRPGASHVLSVAWSSDGEAHLAANRGVLEFPPLPASGPYLITAADFDAGLRRVLLRAYFNVFDCAADSLDPGRIEAWESREAPQAFDKSVERDNQRQRVGKRMRCLGETRPSCLLCSIRANERDRPLLCQLVRDGDD